MNTATRTKTITNPGVVDQAVYRLNPPHTYTDDFTGSTETTDHVIVSAANVYASGPETYIFPSDGNTITGCEIDGSYRGGLDHTRALAAIGYTPQEQK